MSELENVHTDQAPAAIGPYSQAVAVGEWIFTAGQIALDPDSGEMIGGDAVAQAERVLKNLQAILEAAGSSLEQVVKTTMFLADLEDYAAVNEVYGRYFAGSKPARSAVQVARLPKDARVEIEAVARRDAP